ncbi:glycoside hydrolase family 127 protein [Kribbella sindirgiensis]|uniref:Glycoside hydrolase family 127 protein n=1 Tax=Kribbella sindirgiensis TaxID=1124744 RepID=A0A4R0IQ17_9ACTN|nr:beta-L-arabinofuranosidase domain-containing protein [Kribbella sindirgiensis]TCC34650.1 glycoside hydrolase family 127 protein [Kribbella sindirgiensis]
MIAPVMPSAAVVLRPLPDNQVMGGFWHRRMVANRAAIPVGHERLVAAGNIRNLRIAAGQETGAAEGGSFRDSDVYKWLEAAAWDGSPLGQALGGTIVAAQRDDGYLNSAIQVRGEKRYERLWMSHELYCAGHLFQAAVAAARATGDTELLTVATRFADQLVATFGPDRRRDLDGHPAVEMGLVELYRQTGEPSYLELARYFVDARGHGRATKPGFDPSHYGNPAHYADRVPVRQATTVEGHAVRAVYFAAGATDVAIETGDAELLAAVRGQYDAMRRQKQHVNGAVGSRWDGEAFGDVYELPPDRAYAETCAAIGTLHWAWRLLLATGDPQYAEQIELILYNAVLPGVSLSGAEYFYVNTLHRRTDARGDLQRSPAHGRRPWFNCACCPPNVMRTLASLPAYLATGSEDALQIHQYATGKLRSGTFAVDVETDYPWNGRITITVTDAPDHEVELALRIPEWATGAAIDGHPAAPGYAKVSRLFQAGDAVVLDLPMSPRLVVSGANADATRGCVAVARGPLVYAAEQPDQAATVEDLRIDPTANLDAQDRPNLLDGVTTLHTTGLAVSAQDSPYVPYDGRSTEGKPVPITLIPYYTWANRGQHAMRVWIPAV